MTMLLVMLAGGAGAVARFVIGGLISSRVRGELPLGTLLVNVSGSLLIGLLAGAVIFHGAPAALQTVLGTGFLGGYTTFSTASVDTVRLLQSRRRILALINAAGTLVVTVAAAAAGLALAMLCPLT
ncbi:MAG: fluoride efflux transporter CrcB [Actinomycetota bacterium]